MAITLKTGADIEVGLWPVLGGDEYVRVRLTVTEMDGRRAARIMMRRSDDAGDGTTTPAASLGDPDAHSG